MKVKWLSIGPEHVNNYQSVIPEIRKSGLIEHCALKHKVLLNGKSGEGLEQLPGLYLCVSNREIHPPYLSLKVKDNPTFWVVTGTEIEGKSSNWDTSFGDNQGFPLLWRDLFSLSVLAMGQGVKKNPLIRHRWQKTDRGYNPPLHTGYVFQDISNGANMCRR